FPGIRRGMQDGAGQTAFAGNRHARRRHCRFHRIFRAEPEPSVPAVCPHVPRKLPGQISRFFVYGPEGEGCLMRSVTAVSGGAAPEAAEKSPSLFRRMWRYRWLYLLALPGLVYFLVFKIAPMWGLVLAFMEYNPYAGLWASEWIGFKNFEDLFAGEKVYLMLRNTLAINILGLIFMFPAPILLALMLNEVRHEIFKRINQSIVYLPHFLSWVVVASLTFFLLSADIGVVNKILVTLGHEPITFLTNPNYFWFIITVQNIWKEAGWGTIIFLAALAGVDPRLYEAAVMDGASRF